MDKHIDAIIPDQEEDMGLGDQMMERGARLRLLREMERAAEAEAAEEELDEETGEGGGEGCKDKVNEDDGSLIYSSFLNHQRYYDDLKHVDYKAIEYDFGEGDRAVKVKIRQDKRLGKGGLCWDAAFCLVEFLLHSRKTWLKGEGERTNMIELGAGTGMVGICLAKALEADLKGELERGGRAKIVTTDLPELMDLIGTNVEVNGGRGENRVELEHRALSWGFDEEAEIALHNKGEPYHVVFGADIVASLYDPELLVETLAKLSGPKTKLFISFKGRESSYHDRFEAHLKERFKTFDKIMNPKLGSRNHNEGVGIIIIADPF
ncbi:hypothetical protein TrCOL_g3114 [Triparma columacea]|uniref:Uncharacterized protein n=1 Tax=Triparma columacea TaxID=722753 RepID=A0A9W7FZM5_9STRA|nr:hypothetical protein TrCOL_g3114 [Triparma columacea]